MSTNPADSFWSHLLVFEPDEYAQLVRDEQKRLAKRDEIERLEEIALLIKQEKLMRLEIEIEKLKRLEIEIEKLGYFP